MWIKTKEKTKKIKDLSRYYISKHLNNKELLTKIKKWALK